MDPFRNYDAWLQHDPSMDYPDDVPIYKCDVCGAFLKHEPVSSETVPNIQTVEEYDGSKHEEDYSFTRLHRTCTKCCADNIEDFL